MIEASRGLVNSNELPGQWLVLQNLWASFARLL
jgi:hypothetical protein